MGESRKTLLVIGDSISVHYTPHLTQRLQPAWDVIHSEGNTGDSANTLQRMAEYLATTPQADLIIINCGLHDLRRRPDGTYQVPLEDYAANVEAIARNLQQAGRPFVWLTTTPVRDQLLINNPQMSFERYNDDVQRYNAAANKVMADLGLPVIDLYAAVVDAGLERCLLGDGVHMTEEGSGMLADLLAAAVEAHAGRRPATGER